METAGAITYQIKREIKFQILVIEQRDTDKNLRRISIYRRNEYGPWPEVDITTICSAFRKLFKTGQTSGVRKALTFLLQGKPDNVGVLFSAVEETRDPYKGCPFYYNERHLSEVDKKDVYDPTQAKKNAISAYIQKSDDGLREILVISKILNHEEPINVWRTKTISVARLVSRGLWTEARRDQVVKLFDELYEKFSEGGDREPMFLREPDGHGSWILSYHATAETPGGLIYALLHEPA